MLFKLETTQGYYTGEMKAMLESHGVKFDESGSKFAFFDYDDPMDQPKIEIESLHDLIDFTGKWVEQSY